MSRKSFVWSAALAGCVFAAGVTTFLSVRAAAPSPAKPQLDLAKVEAQKGEWSRWRGPNGDGISAEKGLLKEWPKEGPPLAWHAKGFGEGYSSVSVAGGKLFTLGKKGDQIELIAANIKDGSIVWSTPFGGGALPNCTPTVDGNLVYGVSRDGDLGCCDANTGKLLWSKNFSKDFGGKMHSSWGFSESPLVDGKLLIVTPGADKALLAALDKKTGKVIWKTEASSEQLGRNGGDGAAYASIVISHAAGVKQYVTLVGRGLVGVDASNGKLLWNYGPVANGTANVPTPIISGDYVFGSSGYGQGSALVKIVKSGDKFEAEEEYFLEGNKLQNHHGGMIRLGDHIYLGHGHNDGHPVCIDMATGKDAWRANKSPGGASAAIAYADGHLYFRYENATMALIEANPKEYKLKGTFKIKTQNGQSWPHPVIAGGKLYLRDQNDMLCYDIKAK
ncbi:MAG: PQQ-binding-like beta-propeller repeat protein [Pirellulaceae bacterium]